MKRFRHLLTYLLVACFLFNTIVYADDNNEEIANYNENPISQLADEEDSQLGVIDESQFAEEQQDQQIEESENESEEEEGSEQEELVEEALEEQLENTDEAIDIELDGQFPLEYHESGFDVSSLQHSTSSYNATVYSTGKYSLVNVGAVSPVRNQGSYGTCWAFATVASAESNILKKGLASSVDLSELHLAYYTYNKVNDPLGLTNGDYTWTKSVTASNIFNAGGDVQMASIILAGGVGFVNESVLPYSKAASIQSGSKPANSLAYNSTSYYLTNARWLDMRETEYVKQVIMENGAIATSYYESTSYYNSKTAGYYCPDDRTPNHGITIVGWDDDFSKYNFTKTPAGNGAWLVKNSWGASSRNGGYFWISYYDVNLSDIAVQIEVDTLEDLNSIYQYDGSGIVSYMQFTVNNVKVANNYTAQDDEVLKRVGFFSGDSDVKYTISVYTDGDGANPTSGQLVSTTEGRTSFGGYRSVDLSKEVFLRKGTNFSIVIQLVAENKKTVGIMTDNSTSNVYYTYHNECESGQSLYQLGGRTAWNDLAKTGRTARIKAYTFKTNVKFNQSSLDVYIGETVQNGIGAPGSFTYTSSNPLIATVDENTGVATGLMAGEVIITATNEEGISCQYHLTVKNPFICEDKKLIRYEGNLTNIAIPNGIEEIGSEALKGKGLVCVTFPESLTTIGDYCFAENALTEINISEGIVQVGKGAFEGNNLYRVTISSGEKSFGEGAVPITKQTILTIPEEYWLETQQLDPTCVEDGHTAGHYYKYFNEINDCDVIEALGHDYINYVDNHDETCTGYGTATGECSRCESINIITTDKLGPHNYERITVDGKDFEQCTQCAGWHSINGETFTVMNPKTIADSFEGYAVMVEGDKVTIYNTQNSYFATGTIVKIERADGQIDIFYIVVNGDVNGDGIVNSVDYIFIKNHIMKSSVISAESNVLAADYNKDTNINSVDYIGIKNYIMNGGK